MAQDNAYSKLVSTFVTSLRRCTCVLTARPALQYAYQQNDTRTAHLSTARRYNLDPTDTLRCAEKTQRCLSGDQHFFPHKRLYGVLVSGVSCEATIYLKPQ
jgi:hypothetical protein